LLENIQVKEFAEILNIHHFMLSCWRKEYKDGKIVAEERNKVTSTKQDKKYIDRVKEFENENARLR